MDATIVLGVSASTWRSTVHGMLTSSDAGVWVASGATTDPSAEFSACPLGQSMVADRS
jgi:hypothetical protein